MMFDCQKVCIQHRKGTRMYVYDSVSHELVSVTHFDDCPVENIKSKNACTVRSDHDNHAHTCYVDKRKYTGPAKKDKLSFTIMACFPRTLVSPRRYKCKIFII